MCVPSREQEAKFINSNSNIVRNNVDNWRPGGTNGYYLFSKPLTEEEFEDLIELSSKEVKRPSVTVWAYDAKTLELINGSPFDSMKKAADYFNVRYRTILFSSRY